MLKNFLNKITGDSTQSDDSKSRSDACSLPDSSPEHSVMEDSPITSTVARPLDSNKLDEVLSKITLSSDKVQIVICLSPNITSIKFSTFHGLIDSTYSDEIQFSLIDLFFQRIEDMSAKNLELIIEKLRSDENRTKFCKRYREHLLTRVKGFDAKKISDKIIRKSVKNQFNQIFGLPLEIIRERGNGFEIFGTFVKTSDMVVDHTMEFQDPADKYHIVKLTKLARGNIQIEEQTSSGFSSTSMNFSGVWVIDKSGFHME